mgnify:FL=1
MKPSEAAQDVIHEMQMQVVVDTGGRVSLPAVLSYTPADPHAVTATFKTGEGEITWVFARELLRDGMRDIAGNGDIIIRPGHPDRGAQVILTLNSPSGSAVIEGSRHQIAAFMSEVYEMVPEGAEWVYLDIDGAIENMLEA